MPVPGKKGLRHNEPGPDRQKNTAGHPIGFPAYGKALPAGRRIRGHFRRGSAGTHWTHAGGGLNPPFGGLFNSRKLGYTGTLCALRVPHEDIERVAGIINEYHGVTHNYLRNHEYNMWFTMLAESENKLDELLTEIRQKTGITQILNLPAVNLFKVRVNFNL